jgi:hypothetical protein
LVRGLRFGKGVYSWPVLILATLLALVPSVAVGVEVGMNLSMTTYFGRDWGRFREVLLMMIAMIFPLAGLIAFPLMARLGRIWRSLHNRE